MLAYILAGLLGLAAVGWLFLLGTPGQRIGIGIATCLCAAGGLVWWYGWPESAEVPRGKQPAEPATAKIEASLPAPNHEDGYVTAESCRSCHPDQYSTWHATYHRTMTQKATPDAVVPSFDDVTLSSRGRNYYLYRKGDEFRVKTVDPAAEMRRSVQGLVHTEIPDDALVDRQIVMTTGSHFHQTYWMQNPNGTMIQFPWVYHIDSERWVYRIDSFLRPPTDKVTFNIWNTSCIDCHATGAEPRVDYQHHTMHSVGELGISCEACHGPGREHIQWANSTGDVRSRETAIANPNRMNAHNSSQVCGHCHSAAEVHDRGYWSTHGDYYRPGQPETFDKIRTIIQTSEAGTAADQKLGVATKNRFWPDGTVRTGGREYNGLIQSSCYLDGQGKQKMSCLSCHSMHSYDSTNKMMAHNKLGNRMCVQCHGEPRYTTDIAEHTHHPANSAGSRCVNCHMPRTSYALFSAVRSHRIQSPKIADDHRGQRPNACNLCHLDQTREWTALKLRDWHQQPLAELSDESRELAAGLQWGLKGDAAQRAIVAGHLGREEVRRSFAPGWEIPLLAELMEDSYSAVRYMAYEALRSRPAFSDVDFDFDAAPADRRRAISAVMQQWNERSAIRRTAFSQQFLKTVLLNPDGTRDETRYRELRRARDRRPISIFE